MVWAAIIDLNTNHGFGGVDRSCYSTFAKHATIFVGNFLGLFKGTMMKKMIQSCRVDYYAN
jgi:hypothetical protein